MSQKTLVWLGKDDPPEGGKWIVRNFIPRFLALYYQKGRAYLQRKNPFCHDPDLTNYFGEEICSQWRQHWVSFTLFFATQH